MTKKAVELLEDALELTPEDRADLAARLIDSLDSDTNSDSEEAWEAEIDRRIAEIDSGAVKLIAWNDARKVLRDRAEGIAYDSHSPGGPEEGRGRDALVRPARNSRCPCFPTRV